MKITAFNYIKGSLEEKSIVPIENSLSWCLIGRHPNCDFILNSPEVSRVHGIILYQEKAYYYIDLASTDGSRINNQALVVNQSFPLHFGDIIRIGDFFVLFESEEINLESNDNFFFNQETTITPTEKLPYQQQELIVKCSQIIQETDDVKTFRLIAEPPILFNDVLFNYKPGQFVMLNLEINGQQIKRPYSISSTPSRPYNLEITVKRISSGLVSNWLQDDLQIGSKIKISPPMGDFNYFDNSQKKLLFISAGSGITPLMSMSRWLCDTTPDFSVIFIYSARTQKDIIFREELEFMALRYTNFQLAITLTREEFNSTWSGYKGRLNEKMLLEIAPDFQQRIAYVCGSEDFLKSVHAMLQGLNFPMHNYHQENFGSFKIDRPVVIPSQENTLVVFTKSKQQVICHTDETILKAAHREAIKLPYGCQMGVCGQCKLRKISGEVNYEQDFGCEQDYVLTCVAKANGSVVIEG